MREKILEEEVYLPEEGGTGYFCFQNKYGIFEGQSFFNLEEENVKNFSKFVAIRYAEVRARLSFAKMRLKQEKIKLQTIQSLKKDILNNVENPDKKVLRRINLKLRDYTQSISDWDNLCSYLEKAISTQEKEREEILSRSKKDK